MNNDYDPIRYGDEDPPTWPEGEEYTTELGRKCPYGAVIRRGIIVKVMTVDDYPELFEKKCEIAEAKRHFANLKEVSE